MVRSEDGAGGRKQLGPHRQQRMGGEGLKKAYKSRDPQVSAATFPKKPELPGCWGTIPDTPTKPHTPENSARCQLWSP